MCTLLQQTKINNAHKLVCVKQKFVLRVFVLMRFYCIKQVGMYIGTYVCEPILIGGGTGGGGGEGALPPYC